jgi:hypothetical protein
MMRVILLAALAIGCGSSNSAPPSNGSKPGPAGAADSCTTAEDCTLVSACCGCNAGGRQIAIRRDAVAAYEASAEQRCEGNMCAQVISTDPSCDAEATCGSNGRCTVTPHMQHAR